MLPPLARVLAVLFHAGRPATRIWLAATAVTLAVPAAPAHAQLLKRIKQAAAEKAVDAAGRKVLGDEKAADSAATSASNGGGATSSARSAPATAARANAPTKLDITPERVDQFLVAMAPYLEVERERQAYLAADKAVRDYEKCLVTAAQKQAELMMKGQAASPTKAQQAEIDRIMAANDGLSQAMLAAMAANDTARSRVLSDSSLRMSFRASMLMNPMIGKLCGERTPMKPEPLDEQRMRKAALPRKIDGWTPAQFGLLRERIAMHLLMPEKSSLTPEERSAVDGKRAGLQPYVAMWHDTGDWKSWGEIWSAWR